MLSEWFFFVVFLGVGIVLWCEWRRKNRLYAHNIFVEYLKEKDGKLKNSQNGKE